MREKEDRRVIKTKRNLKQTLEQMLTEKSFDKITVKDLCEQAITSRITFYNYYSDKYALLEDMFKDMNDTLQERYAEIQKQNQADDAVTAYQNMLRCFLDLYYEKNDLFHNVNLETNQVLLPPYYHFMLSSTESLIRQYENKYRPNYPVSKLANLIVLGLFGFTHFGSSEEDSKDEVYASSRRVVADLLNSGLFTKME